MSASWPASVALLIPAYKAADSLSRMLPALALKVPAAQILVVDDASADSTASVCASLGITCVSHRLNRGKGRALATGFERLIQKGFTFIVTMDADGQHAIDDLRSFVAALSGHPEAGIVIGARAMRPGKMPLARIFSNRLTSLLLSLFTGQKIDDSQSGYRAYNVGFLKKISIEYDRFEMESEVILKAAALKYPVLFIEVQTLYCSDQSHIAHIPDTLRWIRAVVRVWFHLTVRRR